MDDLGIRAGHGAPPSVLRRLALGRRVAGRAASHARLADAVLRRRAPKLLHASTRIAAPVEVHELAPPPSPLTSVDVGVPSPVEAPPAVPAVAPPATAPPLNDQAASFRAMMKQRYDMPDEMFEAMFGGNTPVYQGLMPTLPPPEATESADAAAGPGEPGAPASPPAHPSGRGAQILEGPPSASAPGPAEGGRAGRAGKRLSSRPAASPPPPVAQAPPQPAPTPTPPRSSAPSSRPSSPRPAAVPPGPAAFVGSRSTEHRSRERPATAGAPADRHRRARRGTGDPAAGGSRAGPRARRRGPRAPRTRLVAGRTDGVRAVHAVLGSCAVPDGPGVRPAHDANLADAAGARRRARCGRAAPARPRGVSHGPVPRCPGTSPATAGATPQRERAPSPAVASAGAAGAATRAASHASTVTGDERAALPPACSGRQDRPTAGAPHRRRLPAPQRRGRCPAAVTVARADCGSCRRADVVAGVRSPTGIDRPATGPVVAGHRTAAGRAAVDGSRSAVALAAHRAGPGLPGDPGVRARAPASPRAPRAAQSQAGRRTVSAAGLACAGNGASLVAGGRRGGGTYRGSAAGGGTHGAGAVIAGAYRRPRAGARHAADAARSHAAAPIRTHSRSHTRSSTRTQSHT